MNSLSSFSKPWLPGGGGGLQRTRLLFLTVLSLHRRAREVGQLWNRRACRVQAPFTSEKEGRGKGIYILYI